MYKLPPTAKKWLLFVHLLFAAIWLGVTVAYLVLSITAAAADDAETLRACYAAMSGLTRSSGRASIIGTVLTGVALSALTHWGLFRYYWIIAKEALTLLSIGLGMIGIYLWTQKAFALVAAEGTGALAHPAYVVNQTQLIAGIALQIVSLAAMFALSVFKPWGKRRERLRSSSDGSA